MKYIAVVDYGAGNLSSVCNSLHYLGFSSRIADTVEKINDSFGVILPGVGAFPDAMQALDASGLRKAVCDAAKKKPFLGICLGMQLLFESSDEVKSCAGLGLLPGHIIRIKTELKLPQIGWNALHVLRSNALTQGISDGDYVYFVHSYMAQPQKQEDLSCTTDYGTQVPAIVSRGNVYGCQFHPEKSGDVGLAILRNFAKLTEA